MMIDTHARCRVCGLDVCSMIQDIPQISFSIYDIIYEQVNLLRPFPDREFLRAELDANGEPKRYRLLSS